jgi:2-polyprenyl-6-hydroxyphenyl methylase/3-demethylubiquinone-9 3-methyltransferase
MATVHQTAKPAATDSSDDPFVAYYEKQSVSAESVARFSRVKELVLRVRRTRGAPADGLDVADIGCNAGTQALMWAGDGHNVHGIDINEPLLAIARERARESGLAVEFVAGTASELPWGSASMDICLMPELLEHIPDWDRCLQEAARILRPGGVLFLSTTNRLCPRQMEFELPLYGWYPAPLKRHFERLAVTTRPELVNHAGFPAINWFTPYQLRERLEQLGFLTWDHFDWIDVQRRGSAVGTATRLIRTLPPLRWLAHVATPYSMVLGVRHL